MRKGFERFLPHDFTITLLERLLVLFAAGYVLKSLKPTCTTCVDDISMQRTSNAETTDDTTLISIKSRGGLHIPSHNVRRICAAAEKSVHHLPTTKGLLTRARRVVVLRTLNYLLLNGWQSQLVCQSHAAQLICDIVSWYAPIRIRHETTKFTQWDYLHQKQNRLVIFSHI